MTLLTTIVRETTDFRARRKQYLDPILAAGNVGVTDRFVYEVGATVHALYTGSENTGSKKVHATPVFHEASPRPFPSYREGVEPRESEAPKPFGDYCFRSN